MFIKYASPAMDEANMTANAACQCGFHNGSGKGSDPVSPSEVERMLDEWYRELHKQLEEMKKKYPDYQHPDLDDN